jgi:hypothetical protein
MGGFRWDCAVENVKKHNTGKGNLQDKSAAVAGEGRFLTSAGKECLHYHAA